MSSDTEFAGASANASARLRAERSGRSTGGCYLRITLKRKEGYNMEFGLFAVIGAVVLVVVGALLAKGNCCGTKKDKNSCCAAPTKSNAGSKDSDKEKAIDELMSK